MTKTVLTKTFTFVSYPKPTPKIKNKGIFRRKKALKKKKRAKLPSIKSLKAKADKIFGDFIKKRDKYTCVLCGSKTNIQCGHMIKRGKLSTRFNEVNCNALCSRCNYKDNFEPQHYVSWFIREYGQLPYIDLVDKSKTVKQLKRIDYEWIIKKYACKTLR